MYQRILVPLDGSATADRGFREALGLAAKLKASLHLLYVVGDFPLMVEMSATMNSEEAFKGLRQYGAKLLADAKGMANAVDVEAEVVIHEAKGQPIADAIVTEARQAACDLIVMGTHGRRGFSRLTLGSEAEGVLRDSPVPVLLVRQAKNAAD